MHPSRSKSSSGSNFPSDDDIGETRQFRKSPSMHTLSATSKRPNFLKSPSMTFGSVLDKLPSSGRETLHSSSDKALHPTFQKLQDSGPLHSSLDSIEAYRSPAEKPKSSSKTKSKTRVFSLKERRRSHSMDVSRDSGLQSFGGSSPASNPNSPKGAKARSQTMQKIHPSSPKGTRAGLKNSPIRVRKKTTDTMESRKSPAVSRKKASMSGQKSPKLPSRKSPNTRVVARNVLSMGRKRGAALKAESASQLKNVNAIEMEYIQRQNQADGIRIMQFTSIIVKMRRSGLLDKRKKFTGADFVDLACSIQSADNREDAVQLGCDMQRLNLMTSKPEFRDSANEIYRFQLEPVCDHLLATLYDVSAECKKLRDAGAEVPPDVLQSCLRSLEAIAGGGTGGSFSDDPSRSSPQTGAYDAALAFVPVALSVLDLDYEQSLEPAVEIEGIRGLEFCGQPLVKSPRLLLKEGHFVLQEDGVAIADFPLTGLSSDTLQDNVIDFVNPRHGSFFRALLHKSQPLVDAVTRASKSLADSLLSKFLQNLFVGSTAMQLCALPSSDKVRCAIMRILSACGAQVAFVEKSVALDIQHAATVDSPSMQRTGVSWLMLQALLLSDSESFLKLTVFSTAEEVHEHSRVSDATQQLLDLVCAHIHVIPTSLRSLLSTVASRVEAKFPGYSRKFISNVFAVGFICEALVKPIDYGYTGPELDDECLRILAAVSLQFQVIIKGTSRTGLVQRNQEALDNLFLFELLRKTRKKEAASPQLVPRRHFDSSQLRSDAIVAYGRSCELAADPEVAPSLPNLHVSMQDPSLPVPSVEGLLLTSSRASQGSSMLSPKSPSDAAASSAAFFGLGSAFQALREHRLPCNESRQVSFRDFALSVGSRTDAQMYLRRMASETVVVLPLGELHDSTLIKFRDGDYEALVSDSEWVASFFWPLCCRERFFFLRTICEVSVMLDDCDFVDIALALLSSPQKLQVLSLWYQNRADHADSPGQVWIDSSPRFDTLMLAELVCSDDEISPFFSTLTESCVARLKESGSGQQWTSATEALKLLTESLAGEPELPLFLSKIFNKVYYITELKFSESGADSVAYMFVHLCLAPFIKRRVRDDCDAFMHKLDMALKEDEEFNTAIDKALGASHSDSWNEDPVDEFQVATMAYVMASRMQGYVSDIVKLLGLPPLGAHRSTEQQFLLSYCNVSLTAVCYRLCFRLVWSRDEEQSASTSGLSETPGRRHTVQQQQQHSSRAWYQPEAIPQSCQEATEDILADHRKLWSLNGMRDELESQGIVLSDEMTQAILLCCEFDVVKAVQLAHSTNKFYSSHQIQVVPLNAVESLISAGILYCDPNTLVDRRGRSLLFMRPARFFPRTMDIKKLALCFGHMFEQLLQDTYTQYKGYVFVADMTGWGWRNYAQTYAVRTWKQLALAPIRIEGIILVNCPSWFKSVYNLFRGALSKRQKALWLQIPSSALTDYIDASCLPVDLGGEFPVDSAAYVGALRRRPFAPHVVLSALQNEAPQDESDSRESLTELVMADYTSTASHSEASEAEEAPRIAPHLISATELVSSFDRQSSGAAAVPTILDLMNFLSKRNRREIGSKLDLGKLQQWLKAEFPQASAEVLIDWLHEDRILFDNKGGPSQTRVIVDDKARYQKSIRGMMWVRELLCARQFLLLRKIAECGKNARDLDVPRLIAEMLSPAEYVALLEAALGELVIVHKGLSDGWEAMLIAESLKRSFAPQLRNVLLLLQPVIEKPRMFQFDQKYGSRGRTPVAGSIAMIGKLCQSIAEALLFSLEATPKFVKGVCWTLRRVFDRKYPGEGLFAVSDMLIHHVVLELLMSPEDAQGAPIDLDQHQKHALRSIASVFSRAVTPEKKLIKIANFEEPLQSVVDEITGPLGAWLDAVSFSQPKLSMAGVVHSQCSLDRMTKLIHCVQDMKAAVALKTRRKGLRSVVVDSFHASQAVDFLLDRFSYEKRSFGVALARELHKYRLIRSAEGSSKTVRFNDGPALFIFGESELTAHELFQRFEDLHQVDSKRSRAKMVRPLFRRIVEHSDSLMHSMSLPPVADIVTNRRFCLFSNRTIEGKTYRELVRWSKKRNPELSVVKVGTSDESDDMSTNAPDSVVSAQGVTKRRSSSGASAGVDVASRLIAAELSSERESIVAALVSRWDMGRSLVVGVLSSKHFDTIEANVVLAELKGREASLLSGVVLDLLKNSVLQRSGLVLLLTMRYLCNSQRPALSDCFWYHAACTLAEEPGANSVGCTLVIDAEDIILVKKNLLHDLNSILQEVPVRFSRVLLMNAVGKGWAKVSNAITVCSVDEILPQDSPWKQQEQRLIDYLKRDVAQETQSTNAAKLSLVLPVQTTPQLSYEERETGDTYERQMREAAISGMSSSSESTYDG